MLDTPSPDWIHVLHVQYGQRSKKQAEATREYTYRYMYWHDATRRDGQTVLSKIIAQRKPPVKERQQEKILKTIFPTQPSHVLINGQNLLLLPPPHLNSSCRVAAHHGEPSQHPPWSAGSGRRNAPVLGAAPRAAGTSASAAGACGRRGRLGSAHPSWGQPSSPQSDAPAPASRRSHATPPHLSW